MKKPNMQQMMGAMMGGAQPPMPQAEMPPPQAQPVPPKPKKKGKPGKGKDFNPFKK